MVKHVSIKICEIYSVSQDKELALNISSVAQKHHFYSEMASTAESGWDFSTRWMR